MGNPIQEAFADIGDLLKDLEKKQNFDIEEWAAKTSEELRVTDGIKCIECKKEKSEREMQKIFARGEGICRHCWNYSGWEGY